MRVSLRRCLRVGARYGQPVEDLGVVPDSLHPLTRRDLLEDNVDLMAAAGRLLAEETPRALRAEAAAPASGMQQLSVTTRSVASVDVYIAGRPVATSPTSDGTTEVIIPFPPPPGTVARIEGFDDSGTLVAATQQVL
jgi:hypothetical protein